MQTSIYTFVGNSKALQQNSTALGWSVWRAASNSQPGWRKREIIERHHAHLHHVAVTFLFLHYCSHVFLESLTIKVKVLRAWQLISNSCSVFLSVMQSTFWVMHLVVHFLYKLRYRSLLRSTVSASQTCI